MVRAPSFTPKSLAFLRALKRHNDRDWFRARRDRYEQHVRQPMITIIERLADDLPAFAPELVAAPRVSLYRIYRDTRFSSDKTPLKTHVAAVFPCRDLPKHQGAGLYFHLSATELFVGGGLYAPLPADLHRVRTHLASNFTRFRAIVDADGFRRSFGAVTGERLQRVPAGFRRDDPAAAYLKLRQVLVFCSRPPDAATSPRFYATLLRLFQRAAPLVRFINEPLRPERSRVGGMS